MKKFSTVVLAALVLVGIMIGVSCAAESAWDAFAEAASKQPETNMFILNNDGSATIVRAPIDLFEISARGGKFNKIYGTNPVELFQNNGPDGAIDSVAYFDDLKIDHSRKTVIGVRRVMWRDMEGREIAEALPPEYNVELSTDEPLYGVSVFFPFPVKVGEFGQIHWKEAAIRKDVVIPADQIFTFYVNPESELYRDNGSELVFPLNAGVLSYPKLLIGEKQ